MRHVPRLLRNQEVQQLVRDLRPISARRPIGYGEGMPPSRALGDAPSGYTEDEIFQAPKGPPLIAPAPAAVNSNSFALYPFSQSTSSGNGGSVTILPQNLRRVLLLIQNQSDPLGTNATMYVNFNGSAGRNQGIALYAGWGVVFDLVCPSDAVAVFMDSATVQPGIIIEGSPRL